MKGLRSLTAVFAGVLLALTLGLAIAPPAFAKEVAGVVMRTTKGKLADGAPILATSDHAVFATDGGANVECEGAAFTGEVVANQAKEGILAITDAAFSGDYENVAGACRYSAGGYALLETAGFPWKLELLPKKGVVLTGKIQLRFTFPETSPQVSCLYEAGKEVAPIHIGGPLVLDFDGASAARTEGPDASCPSTVSLTASFAVTSEGEVVEADVGSVEEGEQPGSMSGTISNPAAEGVAGAAVEACGEIEEEGGGESRVCRATQSGAGGHYSLSSLPPGYYTLTATPAAHSGYAVTSGEEVAVLSDLSTTQNLELRGTAAVHGEITSESSAPLNGVPVSLCEQVEQGECFTATTEPNGAYSFTEVPSADYRLTASPAANRGYARESSSNFALEDGANADENLELPEAGSVTGVVTNQDNDPVSEATVDVCEQQSCYEAHTDAMGAYTIEGVADGEYVATAASELAYNGATSPKFSVSGTASSTVDLIVREAVGPPPGTEIPSGWTTTLDNDVQVPGFYWMEEVPLKTTACAAGHVTATVTGTNTQTLEVQTTSPVTLSEQPPSASGKFEGRLPKLYPIHGPLTIAIEVAGCHQPSEEETKEFNAYVDPSGTVVDGNHADAPIAAATVTLLSGPESFGPFTAVPNGSAVMSPANRKNSDTTTSLGQFGWDTLPGYYEVEAHKSGCGSTTTPAFQVPPPVDNLELVLHCEPLLIESSSLPAANREVHYEAQLVAGGEDPPFKWKKKGALPKGLRVSKTGVLSGTMKRKRVQIGTYAVQVEVKDAAHHTATVTLPLKVR
jgi:Carboxypeptidase regulatory-like domain/Putative Ig domain